MRRTNEENGTTTKGTTRWRCTPPCGSTRRNCTDQAHTRDFHAFHSYATGTTNPNDIANPMGISRRTLDRRFHNLWLIDIPNTPDPHRVYDQFFIDGTYTTTGCLLVTANHDHVIAWRWAITESTQAYTQLLSTIAPPLCVVLDGGQGAFSAIKACWPNTSIQRCLIHAPRVIGRYTTTHPRTDAGKAIYGLAQKLTQIATLDQAREWILRLHEVRQIYKLLPNEKSPVTTHHHTFNHQYKWTHLRVRKAYHWLLHLTKKGWLFTYLQPAPGALEPKRWALTTNSLEGGVNAQIKRIADAHRDQSSERQRRMLEWYLHSQTHLPDDPLTIARQCNFGQDQQAKVSDLVPEDHNTADHQTGRPALYDNAIPTEYNHSIGIRKGPMR